MQDSGKGKAGIVAVSAIVGVVLGGAIAYPIGMNMSKENTMNTNSATVTSSTTTKAADLRATLNNLLREHVTTNLAVNYNIIDNVSEAKLQASMDAQTANAVAIANAVGSVYGDEAKAAVTTPFVEHLKNSNDYAKAVAAGDMAGQETSLKNLQASIRQVAVVFNSVIPSLSVDTLYDALNAHEELMNKADAAYKSGDFANAYKIENEALTQISGGADALSKGIVESKPDMFK